MKKIWKTKAPNKWSVILLDLIGGKRVVGYYLGLDDGSYVLSKGKRPVDERDRFYVSRQHIISGEVIRCRA